MKKLMLATLFGLFLNANAFADKCIVAFNTPETQAVRIPGIVVDFRSINITQLKGNAIVFRGNFTGTITIKYNTKEKIFSAMDLANKKMNACRGK